MEDQKKTSFTFEIDNFSQQKAMISSPNFLSGGCQWFVKVYLKGDRIDDYVSLYLCVANPELLRLGWKRQAEFSFVLLNQSGKELFRKDEICSLFCDQLTGRGRLNALPLKNLQEKGFLEKNKLIVKVEVKVVEVVDEGDVTGKETFDYNGFQVLYSQFPSACWLFFKHPDIAVNFRPKNQLVKTTYMNLLLGLIETLDKPPHSISETELSNAASELIDMTEAGFKLDWLKTKLDEVSLERKKANFDGYRVRELEEHVLSLEQKVSELRDELNKKKAKSASRKASSFKDVIFFWNAKNKSATWRKRSGYEKLD